VVVVAKEICLGLRAAHEQGVAHCNIVPANCFRVLADGAPEVIKLLDFRGASFACKRTGRCTSEPRSVAIGSVAPELITGVSFDFRVDIFALGLLMYQLATNHMPTAQEPTADDPDPRWNSLQAAPFDVSPEFAAVVLKALAQDPAKRHSNAQAMYDALIVVEQASRPPSRLADDPLHWHFEGRPEANSPGGITATTGGPASRAPTNAEPASPPRRSVASWTTLVAMAVLALVATTAIVQTATSAPW
jgi:serine/threonine protein kinase